MKERRRRPPGAWASWLNVLVGLWLLGSSMDYGSPADPFAMWNGFIVGVLVLLFALNAATTWSPVPNWLNVFLGIWLVAAPFLLRYTDTGWATTHNMATGGAIILLAGIGAVAKSPHSVQTMKG